MFHDQDFYRRHLKDILAVQVLQNTEPESETRLRQMSVQNHKNLKTGSELNPAALSSVDSEVRKNLQCSGAQSHITLTAAGPLRT